jgi:serine/threonine-protein kinase
MATSPQIPGYKLIEKVGQGSMGTVYKGKQLSMNRLVAVKILHPRLAANPQDLERFLHEAHLAAKLSHNNIVQAIDAGSADQIHYFIMEYMEGATIGQQLKAGKIFEEREALTIIRQMAKALEHAHRRQLVHRDIKPGNIVITTEGVAKLADLGLARTTSGDGLSKDEKGMMYGTPFYIAPEQILGWGDIDVRADIYALGATLYHMVAGQPPYPGKDIDKILDGHLKQELTPPDHLNTKLSAGLGEVVEFMMAKDRDKRYATPEELLLDLDCLLKGKPPRLARQRIEEAMLQQLATGETAAEEEEAATPAAQGVSVMWVVVLGALLGLSVLLNIFLLLRK